MDVSLGGVVLEAVSLVPPESIFYFLFFILF